MSFCLSHSCGSNAHNFILKGHRTDWDIYNLLCQHRAESALPIKTNHFWKKHICAKMFQVPRLPRLMAISKHSHCWDAFHCSDIDVQCSDTDKVFIADLSQFTWIDVTILLETHSNYLTHKLCCLGDKLIYKWNPSIIWHLNCFLRGQVCE